MVINEVLIHRYNLRMGKWDVMKNENSSEIVKLIEVTKRFIDFAGNLLESGRITKEQYKNMTQNKLRFINDMERKSISK